MQFGAAILLLALSSCITGNGVTALSVVEEAELLGAIRDQRLSLPPLILIPGFASSRLRTWSRVSCPLRMGFRPGDDVWLSLTKIVTATSCWLSCLKLDAFEQLDAPHCRLRADQGLDAITELEPGLVMGPLSDVFMSLVIASKP